MEDILTTLKRVKNNPVQDCFAHQRSVEIGDFCRDTRWPEFTAELSNAGSTQSALAYFLGSLSRPVGVLMFFASTPFDPASRRMAALYAALSAHTLDAAVQADKTSHLELALGSNRRIGIAIGIVMALQGFDEVTAFTTLQDASQSQQSKLREIAEWVILTGEVPALQV